MVCPDGVADGLCRINEVEAPDLSREIDINNDLCRTYMNLIDEVRPNLFLECHNWMIKGYDGIFYLSAWDTISTICRMNIRTPLYFKKPWIKGLNRLIFKMKSSGLKRYAVGQYGTKNVTVEFPWFNRSPNDMKILGWQTLLSIFPIA